ncbi:hypothetical protein [Pseudomonas fluorescens]|jgi:hypothetical protein|uniref:hypothetical protein n=1 Tax=Pseudomonas fluorescens TaxID=294 RepID=UPI001241E98F|nr:hypothetical protein [Pseudomonas fluorescens]
MINLEHFQLSSQKLLLEIHSANTHIIMLVSKQLITGYWWNEALKQQELAYEKWFSFIRSGPSSPVSPKPCCADERLHSLQD